MVLPDRKTLLWIGVGVGLGLVMLDYAIIEPAIHIWSDQSDRIAVLQKKVDRGQSLLDREDRIRNLWAAFNDMNRWKIDSGITLTSLTPNWQAHEDDGYDTFECRAAGTGDQVSIGHFLFDLGTDALPCNLEECEISTRDAHGQQLTMTARFSFARISPDITAGLSGSGTHSSTRGGRSNEE